MIISCFPFFNEIDLLRLRISYEYPFYDAIVIVESTTTYAGRSKILYFKKYQHLFEEYLDKIVYVVVDDMPEIIQKSYIGWNNALALEYRWHLEEHQRNCILRGLSQINLSDNDLVLVNDVDEIVDIKQVEKIANMIKPSEIHYFYLTDYRYSVSLKPKGYQWLGGYVTRYGHLKKSDPSMLRTLAWYYLTYKIFSINQPLHSLKSIKLILISKILKKTNPIESQLISQSSNLLGFNCKEMLTNCAIKKAIYHENSGCHLSFMNGGHDKSVKLKVQNFAHSECYDGSELEDTEKDNYIDQKNYIDEQLRTKLYDFDNLDRDLPIFIREQVEFFPFLLSPNRN